MWGCQSREIRTKFCFSIRISIILKRSCNQNTNLTKMAENPHRPEGGREWGGRKWSSTRLLKDKQNKHSWPQVYIRQTDQDRQQLIPEMRGTGMAKIAEFLDTVIAHPRRWGKCWDEADVKWGRRNQGQTRQTRHEDHQSITWFVVFTVCCHYFCSQYFVISVVFTAVPRQCISLSLLLIIWLAQFNVENQFGVVVVVVINYRSHCGGEILSAMN